MSFRTEELIGTPGDHRNADLFIAHLEDLRTRLRRYKVIYVICDNARFHTVQGSKKLQAYLAQRGHRLPLVYLPLYAPETNPIERVWWLLHDEITRNHRCQYLVMILAALAGAALPATAQAPVTTASAKPAEPGVKFQHPGLFNSRQELDFIKAKVARKSRGWGRWGHEAPLGFATLSTPTAPPRVLLLRCRLKTHKLPTMLAEYAKLAHESDCLGTERGVYNDELCPGAIETRRHPEPTGGLTPWLMPPRATAAS